MSEVQEEIINIPPSGSNGETLSGIRLMSDGSVEVYAESRFKGAVDMLDIWLFTDGKWRPESK